MKLVDRWATDAGGWIISSPVQKTGNPHHDSQGLFSSADGPEASLEKLRAHLRDDDSPVMATLRLMGEASAANLDKVTDPKEVLRSLTEIYKKVGLEGERFTFMADHGKEVQPVASKDMQTPQQCYTNSWQNAMFNDAVDYIDGYAISHGVPISHAWNREDGKDVDHTIPDPDRLKYLGIIIPKSILGQILTSKQWGGSNGALEAVMKMPKAKKAKFLKAIKEANQ